MKTIKIVTLVFLTGFIALFGYANLRRLSVIEKLRPVNLTSVKIEGAMSAQERIELERKISTSPGVTACSLSKDGNVASIIFYPEKTSVKKLNHLLSTDGKYLVSPIELSASGGGCPIHQLNSSIHEFITVLDIRN